MSNANNIIYIAIPFATILRIYEKKHAVTKYYIIMNMTKTREQRIEIITSASFDTVSQHRWFSLILIMEELFHDCIRSKLQKQEVFRYQRGVSMSAA